jgi:hypothetical protein
MKDRENQFEKLCQLASEESWCWNLQCTTCGHSHFRWAFAELAEGKSIDGPDWEVNMGKDSKSLFKRLGSPPMSYDDRQKQNVLEICREANLSTISRECKFPDWLGYLGLVVEHMWHPVQLRPLSSCWAAQLKELVPAHSYIHDRLCQVCEQTEKILNIGDLELCESALMAQGREG